MRLLIDLQSAQNNSRDRGIGRYSLALTRAIIQNSKTHQVFILINALFNNTSSKIRSLLSNLVPEDHIFTFDVHGPVDELPKANNWRTQAAEITREHFINELNPDFVLITSLIEGACDDTVSSIGHTNSGIPVACILYDLIPFLQPEKYIGSPPLNRWYFQKIESLKRASLLLAISQSAANEAIQKLGSEAERVVNISSAADERFVEARFSVEEKANFLKKFGIRSKFVMHTSAFEERKNFEGLIQAFGLLPTLHRRGVQLVLVCKIVEEDRQKLLNLARLSGLEESDVRITGFVTDEDLVSLYSLCYLFVFPSFHEGFGLPALEAMSCGAAVVGSNVSSIPEVIGCNDALFDPHSVENICKVISRALTDRKYYDSLKENASVQAKKFSWKKSAIEAIHAIERFHKATIDATYVAKPDYQPLDDALNCIRNIEIEVAPTDDDLAGIATCIAKNATIASRIRASASFGTPQTWRIEGPYDSSYSLALLNREIARALNSLGHRVVLHSTEGPGDFAPDPEFLRRNIDLEEWSRRVQSFPHDAADVVSRNLYPPRVTDMKGPANLLHAFAWEETGFPEDWADSFNEHLTGLTCLSSHVMKIMVDNGVCVPMAIAGCGVDHWSQIVSANTFYLEARSFRFLHVSSCFPRKGIDILLDAFGAAFTINDNVSLIIKTFPNPHNDIHKLLAARQLQNFQYPHVVVIETDLEDQLLKSLYEQCDVLVAPSRAEGFALPIAEAMLSGIPSITTAWGGQLDFCNEYNSWLVDFDFAKPQTHFNLFSSAWAEPRLNDLVAKLKDAYSTWPEKRKVMAEKGRSLLMNEFTWVDCASRTVNAARQWREGSKTEEDVRIGWVTTWNIKCGIATYSDHLIANMQLTPTVFAPNQDDIIANDDLNCIRSWKTGKDENDLDRLGEAIRNRKINTVVVQFNYGFFNFYQLSKFLEQQIDEGRVVIVILHSTFDPYGDKPNWRLIDLKVSLERCHRLLVHSISDMNRLKAIGVINNVCLFPHGVLIPKREITVRHRSADASPPLVATFGFCLPNKGLKELVNAVSILREQGYPIRLKLVNAEYPDPVSKQLLLDLKNLVDKLSLTELVEIRSEFLEDNEALKEISPANLVVFPYQISGESASGAVRYGLASRRPVAVTPLGIFEDLGEAVYRFSGVTPKEIALGLRQILLELETNSEVSQARSATAERWRESHEYPKIGKRLHNICRALLRNPIGSVSKIAASDRRFRTEIGKVQGRWLKSNGTAGYLLFGPYITLQSGWYKVTIYGITNNIDTLVAKADIAIDRGALVIASTSLSKVIAANVLAELVFCLKDSVKEMEVRVWVGEGSDLSLESIEIRHKSSFSVGEFSERRQKTSLN